MIVELTAVSFIMKPFSTKENNHSCVVQTRICIFSPECCTHKKKKKMINIIAIINVFYLLVLCSLIDYGTAYLNSQLTWTCPGGYLQVQKAEWETHSDCGKVTMYESYPVKRHLQNKCSNKTTSDVTATDSSFGVAVHIHVQYLIMATIVSVSHLFYVYC